MDLTRLQARLNPDPDGESAVRHRSGIVDAVNSDGTVDLDFDGTIVPDVSVLAGAAMAAGLVVQVVAWAGDLLVLGRTADSSGMAGLTLWTPTLEAQTTNPTLGAGSNVTGQYSVVGGWCHGWVRFRFGTSGVGTGTGIYFVQPPVPMHASLIGSDTNYENTTLGHGGGRDNSATAGSQVCRVALNAAGNMAFHSTVGVGFWADNIPWVWAASDRISINFSYPVA